VKRTRVGYCGGKQKDPTYRKVCSDPIYADWAEAVQVEFDESSISYAELVEHFFRSHDASFGSGKRQYMSAIFYHSEEQEKTAQQVLSNFNTQKRVVTVIEPATDFYDAELYHQKWLLQRRRDWFATLELMSPEDLVDGQAAR